MGDQDDDARDFRSLLEGAQAQLSIIADQPLDVTQNLILTSINVNLALAIALGRQTGILARQTTSGDVEVPTPYVKWGIATGTNVFQMRRALQHMSRTVPDWRLKKIQAIKEIRVFTSLGLKESKDLMDLTTQYPEFDDWWR